MEFVQFHPTGMVWPPSVQGHPRHRRRARRRRRAAQQRGPPLHVRRHPGELPQPDRRQSRGRLALHAGRQERPPPARAPHPRPRRPLHRPRDQGRPRQPAWRRVPRHLVDQGEAAERRGAHPQEAAEHVPPVQGAGGHRHHHRADGNRPDDALRDGRRARWTATRRCRRCRACSPPANAPPGSTARIGSAATRCRTCWCSASGPASTPPPSPRRTPRPGVDEQQVDRQHQARARAVRAHRHAPRTRSGFSRICRA